MTTCCEMVSQDKKNMVMGDMVSQDQGNMAVGDMVSTGAGWDWGSGELHDVPRQEEPHGVPGQEEHSGWVMVSQDQENTVVRDMVSMDLGETGTDQEESKEDMVLINLVCKSLITDQSDH